MSLVNSINSTERNTIDSIEKNENKTRFIIDALDNGWSVKKIPESNNCYEFKINHEIILNRPKKSPDVSRSWSEPVHKFQKKDMYDFISKIFR